MLEQKTNCSIFNLSFFFSSRKCLNKQYAAQTRVCSSADELLSAEVGGGRESEELRVKGEGR